jgi:sec-independent protein translocase protein TatB
VPDLGEFIVIGVVALLVIPPERLPAAARSLGLWIGRMQEYVSQMRTEVDRELHLADLKRITEEARDHARAVESAVQGAVSGVQSQIGQVQHDLASTFTMSNASWSGGGTSEAPRSFPKRYRPRPSIDDLTQEIERLKRQLALPPASPGTSRNRYAPRARINRARVRR